MRKLAIFAAAFAVAAAVYVYLFREVRALWVAGAFLVLSPLCLKLGLRRLCAILLGFSAGLIWCFGYQQLHLRPADRLCGTEQNLSVVLQEDPVETSLGFRAVARLTVEGKRYDAVLYGDDSNVIADAGDRVSGLMRIEPAGLNISDGESLYHRSLGITLLLFSEGDLTVEPAEPPWHMKVRQWLRGRIGALYTGQSAGLLQALLIGDRSGLSYGVQNDLSVSGMSHAVAVSGMHVSILLAMISFCLGGNPRLTALIGYPVVLAFVVMTGASPSACRAAVMLGLMLTAPLLRRESDPLTTLGAAALVLLLQNPWAIASVSFQLSFASMLGLITLGNRMQQRWFAKHLQMGKLSRYLVSGMTASVGTTLVTLPLTVCYFGLVSLVAIPVNMAVLWAVTWIFVLGAISCLMGGVGAVLAIPVRILCQYVLRFCDFAAEFPFAAAYPQNPAFVLLAFAMYAALCLILLGKLKRRLLLSSCFAAGFLLCILWGRWDLHHGAVSFRVLDVGQGQATIFQSGGFSAMVDCGSSELDAARLAAHTLYSGGQTHLDALILTHYDEDHAGGVLDLLELVQVGLLVLPDTPDQSGTRQAIADAAECEILYVSELTELTFENGKIVIYPPVIWANDDNSGICVLASAAEYDILITGDLDQYMEMRLIANWELPQVELLVAGHHGAKSATSQILLDTVCPQSVAVSVGEHNRYGHPAQETLQRISAAGADIYRTDLSGTLVFRR